MTIHTTGDSHCYAGWNGVVLHHLGPVLCYSFGKENLKRCNIRDFNMKDGDTIIFCFGEIDCRCHIHKHVSDVSSYEDIINNIIKNYFDAIEINILQLEVKLKNVCVYNVVPPIKKHTVLESPEYPYLGSDEERKHYTLYFNKQLKEKCNEKGYVFFDIYDKYTDENGFLQKDLSDGGVHIRDGIHMSNFIIEHKL